jgi:hypothetical protein
MHIKEKLNSGKFEILRQCYTIEDFLICSGGPLLLHQIGVLQMMRQKLALKDSAVINIP